MKGRRKQRTRILSRSTRARSDLSGNLSRTCTFGTKFCLINLREKRIRNFAFHHILKKTINLRKFAEEKSNIIIRQATTLPGEINFIRSDGRVDLAVLGDHPVPLRLSVKHLQYSRLFPEGVPG